MKKKNIMMEKFKKLCLNSKKIGLFFDIDTDGITSAKLIYEGLNEINCSISNFYPTTPNLLESGDFIRGIENDNLDLIIIVDVELRNNSKFFEKFKNNNIIVFDHHGIDFTPKKENILYFNPKLDNNLDFIPASKVVYDNLMKIVDISKWDWVACLGIIGDSASPVHEKFVKKVFKKYKVTLGEDHKYFFDSSFGLLNNMINSGKMIKGNDGAMTAYKILEISHSHEDLYNRGFLLREWSNSIDDYLEEAIDDFEKNKTEIKDADLFMYMFDPKLKVGSVLSTIVSFKHPHKTVIIFSKKKSLTTISYRRQDKKVNMSLLARKAVKGLHGGGGGHIPAAGGHVSNNDFERLKENIISLLRNHEV